jgi:hypothetical protein
VGIEYWVAVLTVWGKELLHVSDLLFDVSQTQMFVILLLSSKTFDQLKLAVAGTASKWRKPTNYCVPADDQNKAAIKETNREASSVSAMLSPPLQYL